MAGPIRISILADAARAKRELKDVSDRTSSMGKSFLRLAPGMHAIGSGIAAAGKGLLTLAKGAAEDDAAQKTLAKTLQNTVGATDAQVKAVEDYIAKAGIATGITDDQMRPAFANLVRATKDVSKAQGLMGLAMDVSAGTGKDLGAVSLALAKAQNGSVGALGKLGIATKDASGKAKSFTQIQAELTKQFGGQAATAAGSTTGQYRRFMLVLDEIGETVGAAVLPVMGALGRLMLSRVFPAAAKLSGLFESRVVPKLQQFGRFVRAEVVPAVVAMARKIASAVVPVIRDLVTAFTPLVKDIASKAPAAFDALKKVLGGIGSVLTGVVLPTIKAFTGFLRDNQTLVGAVAVGIGAIVIALKLYHGVLAIVSIATKAFAAVQAALNVIMALNPIGIVVLAVIALAAALIYAYKKSETFRRIVDGAFGAVKAGVLAVIGFFKALPGNITKAVGGLGKLLTGKGKDLIFGLARGYLSLWASVGRFFLGIGAAVGRWVGNTARTLFWKGVNFLVGLHQGVVSRVTSFARFIGSLAGSVLRWIGNTALTLFFKGANFIIGLHQGLASRIAGLARFVASIPGSILRWVGDVGRLLWNAGTRIIQGLIDGITSMINPLKNKLTSITNLMPSWKGPQTRDKKLLTPAGRAIIAGLIRGMDDELGTLQRFLRGTSTMIESGLSPSPSVALAGAFTGSAAAGPGLPPIIINVNTLVGGPETGRHLADALDDYFRTNGPRPWSRPA